MIFQTNRLWFREFNDSDLDALALLSSDPEGSRDVGDGAPLSREQTEQWIANSRNNVAKYGYGTGAVVEKNDDKLLGWAGIARPGDGTEEIIYGLDRSCWGQGLGTELLSGIINWAAQDLKLRELRATVHCENTGSITMLTRAGFQLIDPNYDGEEDTHLYCLSLIEARI